MTMEEAKLTQSNKRQPILVDPRGYEFKEKSDLNTSKYWVCRRSGCSVRAVTNHFEDQDPRVKQIIGIHRRRLERPMVSIDENNLNIYKHIINNTKRSFCRFLIISSISLF